MKLSDADYEYIANKTKLKTDRVKILCEEITDLNLILNEVSKSFVKTDAKAISYELYVKLVFLQYAQTTAFELDEKIYVASVAAEYINVLKKGKVKSPPRNKAEQFSKYNLVLAGLFDGKAPSNSLTPKFFLAVENGFWDAGLRDVGKHTEAWVNIMRQIKKDGWFRVAKGDK